MATPSGLFELLLARLAKLRSTLLVFAAVALTFVAYDLYFGTVQARELESDAQDLRQLTRKVETLASYMRLVLHTQYMDRGNSERQKLTSFLYDIRRTRRAFDAANEALLGYPHEVLPVTGDGLTRLRLQERLHPLHKLIYFEQGLPGADGAMPDQLLFISVGINEISGEHSIPQLPIEHLGSLLIAADSMPGVLADLLENFVAGAVQGDHRRAVDALYEGLGSIPVRRVMRGKISEDAKAFLDNVQRLKSACTDPHNTDACALEAKYASPSLQDLLRWEQELVAAKIAQEKRRRGDNAISVPGMPASFPAWLVVLVFSIVVAGVDLQLPALVRRIRGLPHPGKAVLDASEVQYGSATIRAAGYVPANQPHRLWLEVALIIGAAVAFMLFLAWTRPAQVGWAAAAGCALVIWLETRFVLAVRAPMPDRPGFDDAAARSYSYP